MALDFKRLFGGFSTKQIVPTERAIGIDIGAASVKVVELKRQDDLVVLSTYGELQLGPYGEQPLGSAVQLTIQQRTEAVVDLLRESRVTAKAGVFALPLPNSFITTFTLTAKPREDITPRIRIEARKYIPLPLTDVTLDWTELAPIGETPDTVREIFLVAVQNDAQADLRMLQQTIGIKDAHTEIELFSTLRAVAKPDDAAIAVIDLGAQTNKLYIAYHGEVRKIHRVFGGGAQATDTIAQKLQLSFEEAENRKRTYQTDGPDAETIKAAVVGSLERSFQEFKRVIEQFELRSNEKISRIILTGGVATFIDIEPFAGYILDRAVERSNAFGNIAFPAFMEDMLAEIAPSFTAALGAAIRNFE